MAEWLRAAGAQNDVVQWATPYGARWSDAWGECPRGDWLLAIAARVGVLGAPLVRAACDCAADTFDLLADGEERPQATVALARHIASARESDSTVDESLLEDAIDEATRAADGAVDPASAAAASSAVLAAKAVREPQAAAAAAGCAIEANVMAAGDCAMMQALGFSQAKTAELTRAHIPFELIDAALQQKLAQER